MCLRGHIITIATGRVTEREVLKDSLPMRCDDARFRNTFLEESCLDSRSQRVEVWLHVKGFNTVLLNIFS